jgi:hypothetical protein
MSMDYSTAWMIVVVLSKAELGSTVWLLGWNLYLPYSSFFRGIHHTVFISGRDSKHKV